MDIEELNKSQIVLLTMFVAFISSIATGIVTVSLMQQAPPSVAQTVNQVVTKTIERVERVVPQTTTITKEVTINQEDVIAGVIAGANPALFEIYPAQESYTGTSTTPTYSPVGEPRGVGFVVSTTGRVVTSTEVSEVDIAPLIAVFRNGSNVPLKKIVDDAPSEIAILELQRSTGVVPTLALSTTGAVLGRTAIAPSTAVSGDSVSLGIYSFVRAATASSTGEIQPSFSVRPEAIGGPLLDTKGQVVGVMVGERRAISVDVIARLLAGLDATRKAQ